jgi:predicted RNA-binding Zn-ribbon protein involved in translation (DUF1610 family)
MFRSGYNLPPGCFESDLPGWDDTTLTVSADCPECGETHKGKYDGCGKVGVENDFDLTCEKCGHEWVETQTLKRDDWD